MGVPQQIINFFIGCLIRALSVVYHSGFVTHLGMDIRYIFGLVYDPQMVTLELLDTNVQVDRS